MGHCQSKKHKKDKNNKHHKGESVQIVAANTGPAIDHILTTTGTNGGAYANSTVDHLHQANKIAENDPVKKLNDITVEVEVEKPMLSHKTTSSKTYREEMQDLKKNAPYMPHNYNKLSNDDLIFYRHLTNVMKLNIDIDEPITNLQELLMFLERPGAYPPAYVEDLEFHKLYKAWTFFKWIIANIATNNNNVNATMMSQDISVIEGDLFNQKAGNAFEIANLLNNVLTYFGIECLIIPGHLRKEGQTYEEINHCWNAIKLYGKFRLIDCSSAGKNSPYLTSKLNSIKYPEFFFCTIPHHLIYTHYPQDINNTLVPNGGLLLDRGHYENVVALRCNMLIYGFQLFNFKNMIIDARDAYAKSNSDEIHFTFCTYDDTNVNLRLNSQTMSQEELSSQLFTIQKRKFDKELDKSKINTTDYYFLYRDFIDRFEGEIDYSDYKLAVYEVSLRLPKRDIYNMDIYAEKKHDGVVDVCAFDYCFSYKIDANYEDFIESPELEALKYPVTSENFLEKRCHVIEPRNYHLGRSLNAGNNLVFRFKLPKASNAVIYFDNNGEFIQLRREEGDIWSYVHNGKTFNEAVIAACFEDLNENPSAQYLVLVAYTF